MKTNKTESSSIVKDSLDVMKWSLLAACVYLLYGWGYRSDFGLMAKHWIFIFAHLFMFGVKRFTLGNFNGFDLLFGCFYLYFWWENPWGFMASYVVLGYLAYTVLRLTPARDETSD